MILSVAAGGAIAAIAAIAAPIVASVMLSVGGLFMGLAVVRTALVRGPPWRLCRT